jgi:hypothetical protein
MAGILDKKSRLFDYQITQDGRKQIQNNDIRYRYASFSDSSIVYEKDFEKTKLYKNKIDNSEFYFLPLESTTKENSTFVKEFKFDSDNNSYTDIYLFKKPEDLIDLVSYSKEKVEEVSIGTKIKNQKLLYKKSGLTPDTLSFKINTNLDQQEFNFRSNKNINNYPTILNTTTSIRNLLPIHNDKRFSHKINFMKMPPVNIGGQELFERTDFLGLKEFDNKSSIDFLFKSFNEKITFVNEQDRTASIKDILKVLEDSKEVFKKEYKLIEEDNYDTLFFEIFEVNDLNEENFNLEKLIKIKAGEIFDEISGKYKTIYLVGKIKYNNREIVTEEMKDYIKDDLRRFNMAFNDSDSYEFKIYKLSNFYSFINLFTIVFE